jgi:hypothetical protein
VHVGAGSLRKSLKEILEKFDGEIADAIRFDLGIDHAARASAEIDRSRGERLVHGYQKVSGAQDAFLGAERFQHRFAQRDADIFDGVVLVHIEVAVGFYGQVKRAVARHQIQHVVKKADACSH